MFSELVVAHEARAVAVQAVIDEQLGTVLQRGRLGAHRRLVDARGAGGIATAGANSATAANRLMKLITRVFI